MNYVYILHEGSFRVFVYSDEGVDFKIKYFLIYRSNMNDDLTKLFYVDTQTCAYAYVNITNLTNF